MDEKEPETALTPVQTDFQVALRGAVSLWASATTSESERRADLLRDKQRIVLSFFRHTDKLPSEVEPADVQGWLRGLEGKGISAGTCYQHACLLSSFYSWAMRAPEVGQHVRRNPARLARPKPPKPYQTESVKALSDEEVGALVAAVRRKAQAGDVVGKRDYALLLLYLVTGLRRNEAIGGSVSRSKAQTWSGCCPGQRKGRASRSLVTGRPSARRLRRARSSPRVK